MLALYKARVILPANEKQIWHEFDVTTLLSQRYSQVSCGQLNSVRISLRICDVNIRIAFAGSMNQALWVFSPALWINIIGIDQTLLVTQQFTATQLISCIVSSCENKDSQKLVFYLFISSLPWGDLSVTHCFFQRCTAATDKHQHLKKLIIIKNIRILTCFVTVILVLAWRANLQQSLIDSKSHQIFKRNYIHNLGLNNKNRIRRRSPDLLVKFPSGSFRRITTKYQVGGAETKYPQKCKIDFWRHLQFERWLLKYLLTIQLVYPCLKQTLTCKGWRHGEISLRCSTTTTLITKQNNK